MFHITGRATPNYMYASEKKAGARIWYVLFDASRRIDLTGNADKILEFP